MATEQDYDYYRELRPIDRVELDKAEGEGDLHWAEGENRYCFYRRKGYSPEDALAYAIAWCKNAGEQAARRKDHLTGCPS